MWLTAVFFSGWKKKGEASKLHGFPESHSGIAQYSSILLDL
jgi:hypothetical protein